MIKTCASHVAQGAAMTASVKSGCEDQTFVRVLLADDSPSMLQAARRILEPEFEIVGTVDDGQAVLEATESLKPDVLILDLSMA
jgi:CheY-like chemotaxis protein